MLATMGSRSAARCCQKAPFPSSQAACVVLAFVESVPFVVAVGAFFFYRYFSGPTLVHRVIQIKMQEGGS